jgi:hypothetical protein
MRNAERETVRDYLALIFLAKVLPARVPSASWKAFLVGKSEELVVLAAGDSARLVRRSSG